MSGLVPGCQTRQDLVNISEGCAQSSSCLWGILLATIVNVTISITSGCYVMTVPNLSAIACMLAGSLVPPEADVGGARVAAPSPSGAVCEGDEAIPAPKAVKQRKSATARTGDYFFKASRDKGGQATSECFSNMHLSHAFKYAEG